MTSVKAQAAELWTAVLEDMPSSMHEGRALVEARRRLIGMENAAAIGKEIDALAMAAFGAAQIGAPSVAAREDKASPVRPSLEEIEEQVRMAVYASFEGSTDGSAGRAAYFRERALVATEDLLKANPHLGWLKKRRLRVIARSLSDEQVRLVISGAGDEL